MERLPILLSIPHGGIKTPEELQGRVRLEPVDVWNDIDAYSRRVYDLGEQVRTVVTTDVARTFVDLNRAADDRPPENPDGVVKSHTCYQRPIYERGLEPDEELTELLLARYYEPYHGQIRQAVARGPTETLQLGMDCHTMSDTGPDVAPDPGGKRPMICLGNAHGRACPQRTIDNMAACFVDAFGFDSSDVTQNAPFAGAYITQAYGGNPIPWIQVEMNQSLYLEPRRSMRRIPQANPQRLEEVRACFEEALRLYFKRAV
jgi:formiminoglutamase